MVHQQGRKQMTYKRIIQITDPSWINPTAAACRHFGITFQKGHADRENEFIIESNDPHVLRAIETIVDRLVWMGAVMAKA
jgi:hypothetical protein